MRKVMLAFAFILFTGIQASAQITITGKVTDVNNEAIPGANISVKGHSDIGTITDLDGEYILSVPIETTAVVFSYIGMIPQIREIKDKTVFNVVLLEENIKIAEIIVTGYSIRKKEVLTSSVSVVGKDDIEEMTPSTSIDNMLQGKAVGVDVTSYNGKPGSIATVKVRGAVSLNATGGDKAQPLYVVDGVFYSENDMNALNPNDIKSMSVLKDASSAALYGSRGANGVIVITTKSGKSDKPIINYTARYGIAYKIDDKFEIMNTSEKLDYEEAVGGFTYTSEERAELLQYDHIWQDDILKQASIISHSLSASGGSNKSTYFLSAGYDKNTGIIQKLDGFERITARLNFNRDLSEKLKIGFTTNLSHTNSDEPRDINNVQNPIRAMYDYNPYEPIYQHDTDGNVVLDDNGDPVHNLALVLPILEALENNPENEKNLRLIGNAFADYELFKNFHILTKYSISYNRYKRESYTMPGSVLDNIVGDPASPGSKYDNGSDSYNYTWLNKLSYSKSFNNHNFDASVFSEFTKEFFHSYFLGSSGYASDLLNTQDNGSIATGASTSKQENAMFSLASFASYDYASKYLSSVSIRRDGASRFGKDKRHGIFWSFSLGWNLAYEDFLSNSSFINKLKIISSYGTLGSWNIPNYASQGYYVFGAYNGQSAALINGNISNPELTWESQTSMNLGLETAFFQNRLSITADYFINTRSDFLFSNPLPYEGGAYSQYINAGKMETSGVELSVSGDVISTNDFKINLSANISILNYEIKELNGQDQIVVSGISVLKNGEEPFTFYLPRYAGVNPSNGDALYYDVDGNITNVFSSGDAVVLSDKSPLAKMYGGFNTYITYRGIELTVNFSFKYGNYIYNYQALSMLSDGDNVSSNQRKDALDYWQNPGDNKLPRLNGNSNQVSDRFLQDGSYIRLRSVSLGYVLPRNWTLAMKLSKVRFFIQAQNIFTWTKFEGDPEVSVGSGENQLGAGQNFIPGQYAQYSYPALYTYTIGLDINF